MNTSVNILSKAHATTKNKNAPNNIINTHVLLRPKLLFQFVFQNCCFNLFSKQSEQHFLDCFFRNTIPYYYDRCDTCQYSVKKKPPPQDRHQSPENVCNSNIQEEEGDTDYRCNEDDEQEDHSAILG